VARQKAQVGSSPDLLTAISCDISRQPFSESKRYLRGFRNISVKGKRGDVMIEIPLSKATSLISPRLTVLVNTADETGQLNSSPYSWIFPLSVNPPLIGVSIGGKSKHSYLNAKRTGEFVVCVVSTDFGQQAVNCEALHSSRDKLWQKQGLHTQKSKKVTVPRIKEAKAILECKAIKFLEYDGDHLILVGEVVHAEAEQNLEERNPLLHDSGEKFRTIGKQIMLKRRK
jgi:flavin reductase (DIM6/NTAB) family NADH-FMN oxidoreductase RutF